MTDQSPSVRDRAAADICQICGGTMSIATPALKFLHEQVHAEPFEGMLNAYNLRGLPYVLFDRVAKLMEDFARHYSAPSADPKPRPIAPGWYECRSLHGKNRIAMWWDGKFLYESNTVGSTPFAVECFTDFLGPNRLQAG